MCSGGDEPAGIHDSTRPKAPPVVSAVALTVIRFCRNHVVSPSPAAAANGGLSIDCIARRPPYFTNV